MTIRAGAFGDTNAQTSTNTSQSFQLDPTVTDKRFAYLCVATVDSWLHRTDGNADSAEDATSSNSLFVPAKTPILVEAVATDWFSWVRVGSSDGTITFTQVDGRG